MGRSDGQFFGQQDAAVRRLVLEARASGQVQWWMGEPFFCASPPTLLSPDSICMPPPIPTAHTTPIASRMWTGLTKPPRLPDEHLERLSATMSTRSRG